MPEKIFRFRRTFSYLLYLSLLLSCLAVSPTAQASVSDTLAATEAPEQQNTGGLKASLLDLLYTFSGEQATRHLENLSKVSRCLYDPGHAQAGEYLTDELKKIGYTPILQDFPTQYRGATGRNIIVRKPGANSQATHLLTAHWDSSPTPSWPPTCNSLAFGANDNASGSAALLEIARMLSSSEVQFQDDIELAWFDAEEFGYLGSYHFVSQWAGNREVNPLNQPVGAVVNLDMISYTRLQPTGELWVVVEGAASSGLGQESTELVKKYLPHLNYKMYTIGDFFPAGRDPNRQSDQKAFWEGGLGSAIFLTEAVIDIDPRWHTPRDVLVEPDGAKRLNMAFLSEAARTGLLVVGNRARLSSNRVFPTLEPAFEQSWSKADRPVKLATQGGPATGRGWLWGPQPVRAGNEAYVESVDGSRKVVYFDKARLELAADGSVTNGLLVTEMTKGRVQLGDSRFENIGAAQVPVAGDDSENSDAPTYATFSGLTGATHNLSGQWVPDILSKDGAKGINPTLGLQARNKLYVPETGHNIPDVFVKWFESSGRVYEASSDEYTSGAIFDWVTTLGYPITEAYWVKAKVGGQEKTVLVQLFERRALTYTPANSPEWQVEMGNAGLHYLAWRK